jgi:magnesium chelatase family protein
MARAKNHFQVIALNTPCLCGDYGSSVRGCWCSPEQIQAYQTAQAIYRYDFEITIRLEQLQVTDLFGNTKLGESDERILERVKTAQKRMGDVLNRDFEFDPLTTTLDTAGLALLKAAQRQLGLHSGQVYGIVKVAKTVADLAGSDKILVSHVAEAIQYRAKDDYLELTPNVIAKQFAKEL